MRPAGRYLSSRFRATAQVTRNCTPEAAAPFSIDPCQAARRAFSGDVSITQRGAILSARPLARRRAGAA
jgi:hypothetical protein